MSQLQGANVHDHRAAGVIVPFKTRAVGGSACIVLLSDGYAINQS
jgi:hypothetical protein